MLTSTISLKAASIVAVIAAIVGYNVGSLAASSGLNRVNAGELKVAKALSDYQDKRTMAARVHKGAIESFMRIDSDAYLAVANPKLDVAALAEGFMDIDLGTQQAKYPIIYAGMVGAIRLPR